MEKLPIIFRTQKAGDFKGEVTAVFPTIPGTSGYDVTCYAHIGQHSTGSLEWMRNDTRPATDAERADLLAELRGIYTTRPANRPDIYGEPVELVECERITPAMRAQRFEEAGA